MNNSQKELLKLQDGARLRLSVIGIPKYAINPFVDCVFRWVASSGPEWTIKRLKGLKIDLIRRHANLPLQSKWVRKNSSGEFYGVIGSMFRWCSESGNKNKSRKRFDRIIQALNIYTLMSSRDVTMSQIKKFMDGVNCEKDSGLSYLWYEDYLRSVYNAIGHRKINRGGNSLLEYRGSPSKWAPRPHSLKKVHQNSKTIEEILWFEGSKNYQFAWEYAELYSPVTSCIGGPLSIEKYKSLKLDEYLYGGEVHFLQEPGFKLRSICSPYRIHQLALKPLGDAIYSIVRELEWDCTFDQSKALPRIQECLRNGSMVHSIDLTGATDYFPLEVQSETLRQIFGDVKDISLLEDIARMRFRSQIGDIQWKRGQPLGLYPSFGMFTLTHGLILNYLAKGKKGIFYVLGDDVVIMDDQLYRDYIKLLDTMSCPWSADKSISSNSVAEFAGKIITSESIIPQYKWRRMSNDNFLDMCRILGSRSRLLLTNRQKWVFDRVKGLLPPLGLNMSSTGSNLEKTIKATEKFLSLSGEQVVRSLVDLNRLIHNFTYDSTIPYTLNHDVVEDIKGTFDEKVRKVYEQTVVARLTSLYTAFADIPRALDLMPRLPTATYKPSRVSMLERYEGLLRRQLSH